MCLFSLSHLFQNQSVTLISGQETRQEDDLVIHFQRNRVVEYLNVLFFFDVLDVFEQNLDLCLSSEKHYRVVEKAVEVKSLV